MRIAVLSALAALLLSSCGPNLEKLKVLKIPKLSEKPSQKMLVMEIRGDPNNQSREIGKLYRAYYKLQFKGKKMAVALRARWPMHFDVPRSEWVGYWALPVGGEVESLPPGLPSNMRLETWRYGQVAEILHVGPYSKEKPTIEKLYSFISNIGFTIAGLHEEEYIIGPGMFGPGNPDMYYTIIRYEVRPLSAGRRGK